MCAAAEHLAEDLGPICWCISAATVCAVLCKYFCHVSLAGPWQLLAAWHRHLRGRAAARQPPWQLQSAVMMKPGGAALLVCAGLTQVLGQQRTWSILWLGRCSYMTMKKTLHPGTLAPCPRDIPCLRQTCSSSITGRQNLGDVSWEWGVV
jgi:hypothetical protein